MIESKPPVQFVSKHRIASSGTTQLRCNQPAEYLETRGYRTQVGPIYQTIPHRDSVLVLNRVMLDGYTRDFIAYARELGGVLMYDIDDLLFDEEAAGYLDRIGKRRHAGRQRQYREAMSACHVVIAATPYLAEKASEFHPRVHVIRNALSAGYLESAGEVYRARRGLRASSPLVTIAYFSGSSTHDEDFKIVEGALLHLLAENENVKVLLAGSLRFSGSFRRFGNRFEYRTFVPYEAFVDVFREVDVNLVPLDTTSNFCHAKSELKYIEAGACGVPSIASPTKTFKEVIVHGRNGLLAGENHWQEAMQSLIADPEARLRLGDAAREHTLADYSPGPRGKELDELIDSAWRARPAAPPEPNRLKQMVLRTRMEAARAVRRGRRLNRALSSDRRRWKAA